MKICLCVGTRPNFIKAAPLIRAFKKYNIDFRLVHTGQHYDTNMSDAFFMGLSLPEPDVTLGFLKDVFRAAQIKHMTKAVSSYFRIYRPDIAMVLGDVNSTLACAMSARIMEIKIAHVEAGERCGDSNMIEERNRKYIDSVSDYLFCASENSLDNLIDDGMAKRAHLVGNIMIDQLKYIEPLITKDEQEEPYAVLTLHRAENVDSLEKLRKIWDIVVKVSEKIKVIFPCHPRTRKQFEKMTIDGFPFTRIIFCNPLPYLSFTKLVNNAKFVMTDSGGLQMEAAYLNIPCITLRDSTEWVETVSVGTNVVTGIDECKIMFNVNSILNGDYVWIQSMESMIKLNQLHDGNAAERIVEILKKEM